MDHERLNETPHELASCPARAGYRPGQEAARVQATALNDAAMQAWYASGVAPLRPVEADPVDRASDEAMVTAEIQAAMRCAGVPAAAVVFREMAATRRGEFDRSTWTLHINRTLFHDGHSRRALLGTVYHEARHAEQYFDAMRAYAALHPRASAVDLLRAAQRMRRRAPPLYIVQAAFRQPTRDSDACRWYGLYFGEEGAAMRAVHERYQHAKFVVDQIEREAHADRRRSRPLTAAQSAARAARKARADRALEAAHAEYRRLPDEADAHAASEVVREKLRRMP